MTRKTRTRTPDGIRAAVAASVMTNELDRNPLSHPFSAVLRKFSESESTLTAARTEWAKCRKLGERETTVIRSFLDGRISSISVSGAERPGMKRQAPFEGSAAATESSRR